MVFSIKLEQITILFIFPIGMEGVYGYLIRKTHLKSLLNSEKYAVKDKLRGKKNPDIQHTRLFV